MTLHATFTAAGLALALSAGLAAASTLVVDRGLPEINLNNAAGSDRSNVAWGFPGGGFQSGDSFSLAPVGGPGWQIDRLTGWIIAGSPTDDSFTLGDRFGEVALYLGAAGPGGTSIDKVASSTITGGTADAANVTITPVTYAGGAHYQGSGGIDIQIWQIDFLDLGLFAAGDYLFSITGLALPGTSHIWFNHASNAALGGVPADGADDRYAWFSGAADAAALTLGGFFDSSVPGLGWDKSSDINVQVWATAIPVPAALPLLGGGLALLGLMGWRKRRAAA